jgi:hypothetical protein
MNYLSMLSLDKSLQLNTAARNAKGDDVYHPKGVIVDLIGISET